MVIAMDEYTAMEESYKNGYDKGYADAEAKLVRCKDCKCGKRPKTAMFVGKFVNCALYDPMPMMRCNDFCSYGERREGE